MRIVQRFGRIDRLRSPNDRIHLVNFWSNMELEEYINLEQRVSGRMTLVDISVTGEENLIKQDSGNQMNDLEYRRKQQLKLQDAVVNLEDISSGLSISDLTLTDFRRDLPDALACGAFEAATRGGADMSGAQERLAQAIAAVTGRSEERAIGSLFTPGGTHALAGEFAGIEDFEVVAWLAILPPAAAGASAVP